MKKSELRQLIKEELRKLNESSKEQSKFNGKYVDWTTAELEGTQPDMYITYIEYTNGRELSDKELDKLQHEDPDLACEIADTIR